MRSQKVALWILGIVLIVKIGMSFGCIFNGASVTENADGVPLHTFSPAGAQATILYLVAAWGLAHLVIVAFGVAAIVRYRAIVPLLFAVMLAELLLRKLILARVFPVPHVAGTPPGVFVTSALAALMAIGLALSLWKGASR